MTVEGHHRNLLQLPVPWVVGGVMLGRGALAGYFHLFLLGGGALVAAGLAARWVRAKWMTPSVR